MVDDTSRTVVWKAVQNTLDRTVIIRILKPDAAANPTEVDHFLSIARLFARIKSESIAAVFDIVSEGDLHYVVMEHVEGPTLEELISSRGPLSVDKVLRIATSLSHSLSQMWQTAHIVHRNLKSSTIRLDPRGVAKITDFSLAIAAGLGVDATSLDGGHIVGTPCFLSPEQAQGAHMLNTQSDMYALGVVLYHLATGKVPFEDRTVVSILSGHIKEQIPPPHVLNRRMPTAFSWFLHRLMMKNPNNRYEDWEHVLSDIRHVSEGTQPSSVRPDEEYLSTIDIAHTGEGEGSPPLAHDTNRVRLKRKGNRSHIDADQGKLFTNDIRQDDLIRGIVCWTLLAGWLSLVFWFRAVYQCEPPARESPSALGVPEEQAAGRPETAASAPAPELRKEPPQQPAHHEQASPPAKPAERPAAVAATPPPEAPKAKPPEDKPQAGIPPAIAQGLAQAIAKNDLAAARLLVKNAAESFQEKEPLLNLLNEAQDPNAAVAGYLKTQIGKPLLFEHKGKQRTVIPRSVENGVVQLEANGRGAELPLDKLTADEKLRWLDKPQSAADCLTYCMILLQSSRRDELSAQASGCPLLAEVLSQAVSLAPKVTSPDE